MPTYNYPGGSFTSKDPLTSAYSYAGMSPQDALALWYSKHPNGTSPDPNDPGFVKLSTENPQAWQLYKTGQNDNGSSKQVFNPNTGGWDTQKDKGYWSNWESWVQAALGAGLGLTAVGALGSAPAFASSAPAAVTNVGPGPWSTGMIGDTMASGVPSSIAGGGSVGSFLGGSVLDWTKLGLGSLGSFLQGKSSDQNNQLALLVQLLNSQQNREDAMRGSIGNYLSGVQANQMSDDRQRTATGLAATQMDPYAQAKDRNAANVRSSFGAGLAAGGSPQSIVNPSSIDLSALSPSSLDANANYFYKNAAAANPNVPLGDVSPSAEAFRQQNTAAYNQKQQALQDLILKYLSQIGSPVQNQPTLPRV